jgi:hypothetical protein
MTGAVLVCGLLLEAGHFDLFVHTYNHKGEVEPGHLLFQLKATDQPIIFPTESTEPGGCEAAGLVQANDSGTPGETESS